MTRRFLYWSSMVPLSREASAALWISRRRLQTGKWMAATFDFIWTRVEAWILVSIWLLAVWKVQLWASPQTPR